MVPRISFQVLFVAVKMFCWQENKKSESSLVGDCWLFVFACLVFLGNCCRQTGWGFKMAGCKPTYFTSQLEGSIVMDVFSRFCSDFCGMFCKVLAICQAPLFIRTCNYVVCISHLAHSGRKGIEPVKLNQYFI